MTSWGCGVATENLWNRASRLSLSLSLSLGVGVAACGGGTELSGVDHDPDPSDSHGPNEPHGSNGPQSDGGQAVAAGTTEDEIPGLDTDAPASMTGAPTPADSGTASDGAAANGSPAPEAPIAIEACETLITRARCSLGKIKDPEARGVAETALRRTTQTWRDLVADLRTHQLALEACAASLKASADGYESQGCADG